MRRGWQRASASGLRTRLCSARRRRRLPVLPAVRSFDAVLLSHVHIYIFRGSTTAVWQAGGASGAGGRAAQAAAAGRRRHCWHIQHACGRPTWWWRAWAWAWTWAWKRARCFKPRDGAHRQQVGRHWPTPPAPVTAAATARQGHDVRCCTRQSTVSHCRHPHRRSHSSLLQSFRYFREHQFFCGTSPAKESQ